MDVSQEVKLINRDEMTDEGKGSRGLQHGANGVDGHHNQSINDTVTCDSLRSEVRVAAPNDVVVVASSRLRSAAAAAPAVAVIT